MPKSLLDRLSSSQLAPTSQGEYAYYGKEQIILPNQINSTSVSPAKTPTYVSPLDTSYVNEGYVLYGYALDSDK